jgi:hypothetical protein
MTDNGKIRDFGKTRNALTAVADLRPEEVQELLSQIRAKVADLDDNQIMSLYAVLIQLGIVPKF